MAGTLTVHHWPVRPIKLNPRKRKKYYTLKEQKTEKKETFRVNIKS